MSETIFGLSKIQLGSAKSFKFFPKYVAFHKLNVTRIARGAPNQHSEQCQRSFSGNLHSSVKPQDSPGKHVKC